MWYLSSLAESIFLILGTNAESDSGTVVKVFWHFRGWTNERKLQIFNLID